MFNFKEFITEQKNTHMTHIEDKVLYGGVDGTRQAILALRSLRDKTDIYEEGGKPRRLCLDEHKFRGCETIITEADRRIKARGAQK